MIIVENHPELKYRYALFTWGGFYNKQYQEKHGHVEGRKVFDTLEERQQYLTMLQGIELAMDARHLAYTLDEGFAIDTPVILHRVTKYEDKYYYSKNVIDTFSTFTDEFGGASYIMNWKWIPGFNDEPIGDSDEVDYSNHEIIQEWITGAFKPEEP